MTTIITDGNFVIADKRTSSWWPNDFHYNERRTRFSNLTPGRVATDSVNKIVTFADKESVTFRGAKLAALAFAGEKNVGVLMTRIVKQHGAVDYYLSQMEFTPVTDFHATSFLLVFDDGSSQRIKLTQTPGRNKLDVKVFHPDPKETVVAVGSGAGLYHSLIQFLPENHTSKVSLLDLFFFMVHTDKLSSTDYDVYSLSEKKLVKNCKPSQEAVLDSVKKIQALLDFTKTPKIPFQLIEMTDIKKEFANVD